MEIRNCTISGLNYFINDGDVMKPCKPNEHDPAYDGAGIYRCRECGVQFVEAGAVEAACDEIEKIVQLDVVPITIGGTATEEYET
jgi:hypothetical protein